MRGVLARWGVGKQKHGVGPWDWETEEMEAWEKGGKIGTSVAVAHSRLQMVQRAAKARKRRQRKERIDEARRNKEEAKAQMGEEQAERAERRVRRDQKERKRRPVGHCRPQAEHDQRRGGIMEAKWKRGGRTDAYDREGTGGEGRRVAV